MNATNTHQELYPETASKNQEVLSQLLALMGYDAEVMEEIDDDGRVMLNITGQGTEALTDNKGQILDALQFVLSRILSRQDGNRAQLLVDCGGYRKRRKNALIEMAHQLAEKATLSGKIIAVNPMSAQDRRVIHMALKQTSGLSTRSEGEGLERRLLIIPDK